MVGSAADSCLTCVTASVGSAVAVPVAGGRVLVDFRSAVGGSVTEDCGIVEVTTSAVGMMTAGVARLPPGGSHRKWLCCGGRRL